MSQEKKPNLGMAGHEDLSEALQDMLIQRAEQHPTGERVLFRSIVLGEGAHDEGRLLTGAQILFDKGELFQEGSPDPSELLGELDSKGNLHFTVTYKDSGESETIVLPKDDWEYKH